MDKKAYQEAIREFARSGGVANFKKHGKEFYSEMGKRSGISRQAKKLLKSANLS